MRRLLSMRRTGLKRLFCGRFSKTSPFRFHPYFIAIQSVTVTSTRRDGKIRKPPGNQSLA